MTQCLRVALYSPPRAPRSLPASLVDQPRGLALPAPALIDLAPLLPLAVPCFPRSLCIATPQTYVGTRLVEVLLRNSLFSGPILCVCYTNHALDQFLEGLLKAGIAQTNPAELVRIGQCIQL